MRALLKELHDEHQHILTLIEHKEILRLLDFVETVHHPKEEDHLFPHLALHPLLRQGGPRCMYFKGLELELRVHASAQKLLTEFYQNGGPHPSDYKDFAWLADQNPLNLPMYEHRLGHELASAIRYFMARPSCLENARHLENFCQEYCRLLKLHIEKEETCLFVMAERIMKTS